jgi:hypothetical protein
MKKILLLITGLLLFFSVEGQILRYSNYTAPTPPAQLVESIDVFGTGGATTISTYGGTLQMLKKTLPTDAADTTATWSRTNGTGTANISGTGLLTALTDGTVTARATANDGSAVYGEEIITISNQTSYATEYQTVYDAMGTKPSAGTATAQNTMVNSLVSGGYWARMDLLYIFATDATTVEAKINWVTPGTYNLTDPGSTNPTFTSLEGYTGDGSSDYLSTSYAPYTNYDNIAINSTTLGAYTRTHTTNTGRVIGLYEHSSGDKLWELIPNNYDYLSGTLNSYSGFGYEQSSDIGTAMVTRRGSTESEIYRNGVSLGSDATVSTNFPLSGAVYILAQNNVGTGAEEFYGDQVSIIFVMDAISDAEATALNTIFETYMDAIGKGVQ